MNIRQDYSVLRVRKETYTAAKREADYRGLKLWALADMALNAYLKNERGL